MRTKTNLFVLIFTFLFTAILLTTNQVFAVGEIEEVGTYEELRDALESGKSVKLMNNIEIDGNSVAKSSRSLGVAIIGAGDITVDGNGFTVSDNDKTVRTNFEIYADGGAVNVTLKNITITNAYTKGRALDTRTGDVTVNLVNSKLETIGSNNTQTLTIGGPTGPVNVNITNSNIEAKGAGYGIITYNPVNMTIKGSTVTGYAALYMKGADSSFGSNGSVVKVKNSNLNGKNTYSGKTDNFGAVVFEDGGINISIEDSKVNATGDGKASQVAIAESTYGLQSGASFDKPNTINISGKSTINAKNELIVLLNNNASGSKVTVASGVVSNKQIPNTYLPTGTVNKELSDGTFIVEEIKTSVEVSPEKPEIPEVQEKEEKPIAQEKDETPKTGMSNISSYLWTTLATIALLGIVIINKNRKNN